MTLINVAECDACRRRVDTRGPLWPDVMPGWLTVRPAQEGTASLHFCRQGCLAAYGRTPDGHLLAGARVETATP